MGRPGTGAIGLPCRVLSSRAIAPAHCHGNYVTKRVHACTLRYCTIGMQSWSWPVCPPSESTYTCYARYYGYGTPFVTKSWRDYKRPTWRLRRSDQQETSNDGEYFSTEVFDFKLQFGTITGRPSLPGILQTRPRNDAVR